MGRGFEPHRRHQEVAARGWVSYRRTGAKCGFVPNLSRSAATGDLCAAVLGYRRERSSAERGARRPAWYGRYRLPDAWSRCCAMPRGANIELREVTGRARPERKPFPIIGRWLWRRRRATGCPSRSAQSVLDGGQLTRGRRPTRIEGRGHRASGPAASRGLDSDRRLRAQRWPNFPQSVPLDRYGRAIADRAATSTRVISGFGGVLRSVPTFREIERTGAVLHGRVRLASVTAQMGSGRHHCTAARIGGRTQRAGQLRAQLVVDQRPKHRALNGDPAQRPGPSTPRPTTARPHTNPSARRLHQPLGGDPRQTHRPGVASRSRPVRHTEQDAPLEPPRRRLEPPITHEPPLAGSTRQ